MASSVDVPVIFLMPEAAAISLQEQIERGADGISDSVGNLGVLNLLHWKYIGVILR